MMFLIPIKVSDVGKRKGLVAIWPLWLLFCLFVSTAYGIILTLRATEFAADEAGLSRTSTMLLHRAETCKEMWTPFKEVPPLPMTVHTLEESTWWTRTKWTAQRKANRAARRVHMALQFANVALVFLLPPRHDGGEEKDYRVRRRVWIGNAFAVFCVLLLITGECTDMPSHDPPRGNVNGTINVGHSLRGTD